MTLINPVELPNKVAVKLEKLMDVEGVLKLGSSNVYLSTTKH